MTEGDNKKVDVFQSKCLRRIYKVHWPYVISNDELLKRSEVVRQRRWIWIGHVLRMDHSSNCATALTWAPEGTRKVGRPKTTWRRRVEKWKRITRMDIMEPSQNTNTEQKQLALSYQGLMRQRAWRRKVKVKVLNVRLWHICMFWVVNATGKWMHQLCVVQCYSKRLSSQLKGLSNATNKILQ